VFVTPTSAAIVVGGAIQLTATPADTGRDPVRASPVTWSTDNPSVAVVSASGLVTAVGQGQATISASVDGGRVTGLAHIQVVPPTSLIIDGVWDWTERIVGSSVTCNDTGSYLFTQVGVNFTGQSQQVGSCRASGDNARTDPVTTGLITVNDISFVVGSGGTCSYTGHATGTPAASVSGTVSCSDGSTGTWGAVRQGAIGSVTVSPSTATLFPGTTAQLAAAPADGQGSRVFFRPVAWSSDKPSVATVSGSGLVTAVALGSATITASAGGKSGTATITVVAPAASVKVTPVFDTVATGGTVQYTAVPMDAAGNPLTGRTVYWSSSNATVATITGTGLATAVAAGGTGIFAAVENVTGSTPLTVTGTPVAIGGEWSFTEEFDGTDVEGNTVLVCADSGSLVLSQNGLSFTGTSAQVGSCADETQRQVTSGALSGRVLSYSAGGCGYGATVGTTQPTPLSGSGSCSGGQTVTLQAVRVGPAASLTVSPASVTLVSGGSVQLGATLRDAAGSIMYGHPITWSSDNQVAVTISVSGRLSAVAAGSATISTTLDGAANAELFVEAATERPEVKFDLFRQLDRAAPPGAILATNTSSIPITGIAAQTKRPAQVIGMHFMNPVPLMQLVEVIRGLETSDQTVAKTVEVATALGKTAVLVNDSPGFVSNRVLMPMINEAIFCVLEGVATPEAIDTVMKLGMNHPQGPLALADLIGLDVCLATLEVLHRDLGDDKYRPCPLLRTMVAAGRLGRKSGRGFHVYGA
jgi:3-hydroxybutyryl-CoA dehydrogenase